MTDLLVTIFTGLASLWDSFLSFLGTEFTFSLFGDEYTFHLIAILFGGGLIAVLTYAIIKWFTPIL